MTKIDAARTRRLLASSDQLEGRARGDVLEALIADVFAAIPGVQLMSRAKKNIGKSREFDLAFSVRSSARGLENFDPELPIECKNWDRPVGSEEVGWFVTKLRRARVGVGVLVATSGVTGDPEVPTAAYAELSDAQAEGITVVVLERAELETMESGEQLAHVLEVKRFMMKLYGRYERASVVILPPSLPSLDDDENNSHQATKSTRTSNGSLGPGSSSNSAVRPEVIGDAQRILVLGEFYRGDNYGPDLELVIGDLSKLIAGVGLRADALLSVGDLTSQGGMPDFAPSWTDLAMLREQVGASALVATIGNHDRERSARGSEMSYLLDLVPSFPISTSSAEAYRYHSAGFAIYDSPPLRIVSIDTEAATAVGEPIIDVHMKRRLCEVLDDGGERQANILLSHRPISDCVNGVELSSALDPALYGPWIHVHGSAQKGVISYATASGDVTEVTVQPLRGGYGWQQTLPRASAILIELPMTRAPRGMNLRGRFRAWTWYLGEGWVPSVLPGGSAGGFGFRASFTGLAAKIKQALSGSSTRYMEWSEISIVLPELAFLSPGDLLRLVDLLKTEGIMMENNMSGEPFVAYDDGGDSSN
jgi:hypothetical protein